MVSKLFRAYRLYNQILLDNENETGMVSKLFRAYRLYNDVDFICTRFIGEVSKLFRAYRLYNTAKKYAPETAAGGFKALSSLQVI